MQPRFLKLLLVIAFSSFALCSFGQCDAKLKAFYTSYMQNAESNDVANDKLLKAHMSPQLISKLRDAAAEFEADAVIHSQDVCEYCAKSLTVTRQKNDWYVVKYKWSPDSEYTCISVKAVEKDGKLIILDILPIGSKCPGL